MPRLLTLWLDFGSNVPDQGEEKSLKLMIFLNKFLFLGKKRQEKNSMKTTLAQLNEVWITNV